MTNYKTTIDAMIAWYDKYKPTGKYITQPEERRFRGCQIAGTYADMNFLYSYVLSTFTSKKHLSLDVFNCSRGGLRARLEDSEEMFCCNSTLFAMQIGMIKKQKYEKLPPIITNSSFVKAMYADLQLVHKKTTLGNELCNDFLDLGLLYEYNQNGESKYTLTAAIMYMMIVEYRDRSHKEDIETDKKNRNNEKKLNRPL